MALKTIFLPYNGNMFCLRLKTAFHCMETCFGAEMCGNEGGFVKTLEDLSVPQSCLGGPSFERSGVFGDDLAEEGVVGQNRGWRAWRREGWRGVVGNLAILAARRALTVTGRPGDHTARQGQGVGEGTGRY